VFFAAAMWLLSGATSASGPSDLAFPLLLRGFGLGFLFISLTMIALPRMGSSALPFGIGLFDFCKQAGGQLGPAVMQTYIDHHTALASTVLSAHLVEGGPRLEAWLRTAASTLASHGYFEAPSSMVAIPLLQRMLAKQAAAIAFDEAFFALVVFFAAAAPVLILAKQLVGREPTQGG
jgi:DHA2 family multidrug resistance protein